MPLIADNIPSDVSHEEFLQLAVSKRKHRIASSKRFHVSHIRYLMQNVSKTKLKLSSGAQLNLRVEKRENLILFLRDTYRTLDSDCPAKQEIKECLGRISEVNSSEKLRLGALKYLNEIRSPSDQGEARVLNFDGMILQKNKGESESAHQSAQNEWAGAPLQPVSHNRSSLVGAHQMGGSRSLHASPNISASFNGSSIKPTTGGVGMSEEDKNVFDGRAESLLKTPQQTSFSRTAPNSTSVDPRYLTPLPATGTVPAPHSYPQAHHARSRSAHHSRSVSAMPQFTQDTATPENIAQLKEKINRSKRGDLKTDYDPYEKDRRKKLAFETPEEKGKKKKKKKEPISAGLSLYSIFSKPESLLERIQEEIRKEERELEQNPGILENLRALEQLVIERQKIKQQLMQERDDYLRRKTANSDKAPAVREALHKQWESRNEKISLEIFRVEEESILIMEELREHTSWLAICQDLVIEHAARRVEHFLYILIAYYGTFAHPLQNHPQLQHGKGRNLRNATRTKLTDGSHSSLFSQLIDLTFIYSPTVEKLNYKNKGEAAPREGLLCGTHYLDMINSVMELPYIVNLAIDKRLEGGIVEEGRGQQSEYRKAALRIIQEVADSLYDPIEGLKKYLELTKQVFAEIKAEIEGNRKKSPNEKKLHLQSLKLEEIGTFKEDPTCNMGPIINTNGTIQREYLNMLLANDRENREQLDRLERIIREAEEKRARLLHGLMLKTKEHILSTPSANVDLGEDKNIPPPPYDDGEGPLPPLRFDEGFDNAPNTGVTVSSSSSSSSSRSSASVLPHDEPFLLIGNGKEDKDDSEESKQEEKKDDFEDEEETTFNEGGEREDWYTGKDIRILLKHFYGKREDIKIFESIDALQHHGGVLATNLDEARLQGVLRGDCREINILPINLGRRHWAALILRFNSEDKTAPSAWYVDPLGHKIPAEVSNAVRIVYQNADILSVNIKLQRDNHNCGPWIIAAFQNLIEAGNLPPEDFDIAVAREIYDNILQRSRAIEATESDQKSTAPDFLQEVMAQHPATEIPQSYPLPPYQGTSENNHLLEDKQEESAAEKLLKNYEAQTERVVHLEKEIADQKEQIATLIKEKDAYLQEISQLKDGVKAENSVEAKGVHDDVVINIHPTERDPQRPSYRRSSSNFWQEGKKPLLDNTTEKQEESDCCNTWCTIL